MIRVLRFGCLLSPILALFFDAELDEGWRAFKLEYGRQYDDPVENIQRRVIWERMMHFIETHNQEAAAGLHSYTVGPNQFSDMTTDEFTSTMNGFNESLDLNKNVCQMYSPPKDIRIENYNTTVDWRLNGYVTDIKDQGLCGSGYAFSTTGSLEGQHFRATGNLVSLSEQNIVDCSFTQGNMGCDGGNMNNAFQYLKESDGIDSEKSYPYTQSIGKCDTKVKHNGANMTACKNILQGSERDLQIAVALEGPVSVAIDASQRGFQSYKSGIYDDPKCTRTLDHAVLIVGYGTEGGKDYWLVKNSWGTKWGDKGYIKMSRNNKNQCGIANTASFPMV